VLTDRSAPRWVSLWFRGAAIYGAVALLLSLLAPPIPGPGRLAQLGFIFTALAFQIVFWLIGGQPARYRLLMLTGVAEKLAFGVPALWLAAQGDGEPATALFGAIDLILGAGFLLAWRATPRG